MDPVVEYLVPHHGLRLVLRLHAAVQELRVERLEGHLVQVMMLQVLLRLLVEIDDFDGLDLLLLVCFQAAGLRGGRGEFLQVLLQVIPALIGCSGQLPPERSSSVEVSLSLKVLLA